MLVTDFPVTEFENRLERVQHKMRGKKLDALFFTSEAEIRYFTGFRTLFWQSPTRPWFLIIPATGKPIAVIPEIGRALMAATWVDDIRTWSSPNMDDDGVTLLVSALHLYKNVGMLMGAESTLRMPLLDFNDMRQRLPGTHFYNASPLVQSVRMIKSTAEIEKISAICEIASNSFDHAENFFYEEQPLDQAFKAFKIDLLKQGAEDVPYLVGGCGQDGYDDVISPPNQRPMQKGDILMLDTGATKDGYFCDFDRNFAISHASDSAKHAYQTLTRATDAALNITRPGATCSDLFMAMQKIIDQPSTDVGRYGHGLGIGLTEPPSLIDFDETVLQTGMVITLEPSMTTSDQKIMVFEENIVIEDGLPRLLSRRAQPELPIL